MAVGDSSDHAYFIKYKTPEGIRRAVIQAPRGLKDDKLKLAVSNVFSKLLQDPRFSSKSTPVGAKHKFTPLVSIISYKEKGNELSIDFIHRGITETLIVSGSASQGKDTPVVIDVSSIRALRRIAPPKASAHFYRLWAEWKSTTSWPVFLILGLFVYLWLYCIKSSRLDPIEIQLIEQRGFNNGPEGLLASLKESLAFMPPPSKDEKGKVENDALAKAYAATAQCLETGTQAKVLLNSKKGLQEYARKIEAEIKQQHASMTEPGLIRTVPMGYYQDGVYYPVLLTFSRDAQGRLLIEKITTDPSDQEDFRYVCWNDRAGEAAAKEKEVASKQTSIATLLSSLWSLQSDKQPLRPLSEKERQEAKTLESHYVGLKEKSQQEEKLSQSLSMHQVFDLVLKNETQVVEAKEKAEGQLKTTPRRDPMQLVMRWSERHFRATSIGDRMGFMMDVIGHHLEVFSRHIDTLNASQKGTLLRLVHEQVGKLKLMVNTALGDEMAFEQLAKELPVFQQLHDRIFRLERDLKNYDAVEMHTQGSALLHAMQKSTESALSLDIERTVPIDASTAVATSVSPKHVFEQQGKIKDLTDAIQTNDGERSLRLFGELTQAVDKAVEARDYRQAVALGIQILSALPIPMNVRSPANASQYLETFWDKLTKGQLDQWGGKLTAITKYIFEAKLKLEDTHLWPMQRTELFAVQAMLVKIRRRKVELIAEEVGLDIQKMRSNLANNYYDLESYRLALLRGLLAGARTLTSDQKEKLAKLTGIEKDGSKQDFYNDSRLGSNDRKIFEALNLSLEDAQELGLDFCETSSQLLKDVDEELYLIEGDRVRNDRLKAIQAYLHQDTHARFYNSYLPLESYNKEIEDVNKLFNNWYGSLLPAPAYLTSRRTEASDGKTRRALPNSIVDLRVHYVMMECIMHPEAYLFVNFPETQRGKTNRENWFRNLRIEALSLVANPQDTNEVNKKISELHRREVLQRIHAMGRLELDVEPFEYKNFEYKNYPNIKIVPRQLLGDPNADLGIRFTRERRLPNEPSFPEQGNPDHAAPALGTVDPRLARAKVTFNITSHVPLPDLQSEVSIAHKVTTDSLTSLADQFALSTLHIEGWTKYGNGIEKRILNSALEGIELICLQPHLLVREENQRLIELAILKPGILEKLCIVNPQFLVERSAILKKLIGQAIARGDVATAGFLMQIGERIRQAFLHVITLLPSDENQKKILEVASQHEKGRKELTINLLTGPGLSWQDLAPHGSRNTPVPTREFLNKALEQIPSYETQYKVEEVQQKERAEGRSIDQIGIEALANGLKTQRSKKAIATYFLDYCRCYPSATLTSERVGMMLYAYSILKNYGEEAALPFLQHQLIEWMEFLWIPQLVQDQSKLMDESLNIFYGLATGDRLQEKWMASKDDPFTFVCKKASFHLISGILNTQSHVNRLQNVIPSEICNHPDFKFVFGSRTFSANCQATSTPHVFRYNIRTNGKNFQLEFNHRTKELVIKLEIPEVAPGTFCTWHRMESDPGRSSVEKAIQSRGIWVSSSKGIPLAFAILKSPLQYQPMDILKLNVDQNLHVESATTVGDDLIVCHDRTGRLSGWLSAFDSSDILFLSAHPGAPPSQIRILSLGIQLERQQDHHSWQIVSPQKYAGCHWITDLSQASETAQSIARALGPEVVSNCVFPLRQAQDNKERLLIFPNFLQPGMSPTPSGYLPLRFQRPSPGYPPIELTISPEGAIQTTAVGYLYLYYLFYAKGDLKRASLYLERAVKASTRLASPEDKNLFEEISKVVQLLPRNNLRQLALQIKTELAFERIRREQLNQMQFDPRHPERFTQKAKRIADLLTAYELRMEKVSKTRPELHIESELNFTEEEKKMLAMIRRASLHHAMSTLPRPSVVKQERLEMKSVKSLEEAPSEFLTLLMTLMAPQKETPPQSITNLTVIDENLIRYFWHYAKEILTKNLSPNKLVMLFASSVRPAANNTPEEKALIGCIEFARRALLSIAGANRLALKDKDIDKYFSELFTAHSYLPSTPLQTTKIPILKYIYESRHQAALKIRNVFKDTLNTIFARTTENIVVVPELSIAKKIGSNTPRQPNFEAALDKMLDALPPSVRKEMVAQIKHLRSTNQLHDNMSSTEISNLLQNSMNRAAEEQRLHAVTQHVAELEKQLATKAIIPPSNLGKDYAQVTVTPHLVSSMMNSIEGFFVHAKADRSEMSKSLEESFNKLGVSRMEQNENQQLAEGLREAALELNGQGRKELSEQNISNVKSAVESRTKELETSINESRTKVFAWARSSAAPSQVRNWMHHLDAYGEHEVFEQILELYQRGKLVGALPGSEHQGVCLMITEFLFQHTEYQQLRKALSNLEELSTAYQKARKDVGGRASFWQAECRRLSHAIYQDIQMGTNWHRHLTLGTNTLKNPPFSRKFLVAEYRSGTILRAEQRKLIEDLVTDPTRIAQLRMGMGKTSFGIPLIILLLAESGYLVNALFTQQLIKMNRVSLDQRTRSFQRQASMDFELDLNALESPAYLAEVYAKFLQSRIDGSYNISSIEQIAAVENRLTLVAEQLSKLWIQIKTKTEKYNAALKYQKDKEDRSLLTLRQEIADLNVKFQQFQKQKQWLIKLKKIFDDPNTLFILDEADEMLNPRKQKNIAIGRRGPNLEVANQMNRLMHLLIGSAKVKQDQAGITREEAEALSELSKAIRNNQQAVKTESQIKSALSALAKQLYADMNVIAWVPPIAPEAWANFITGRSSDPLPAVDVDKSRQIKILQSLFSSLLKVLNRNPNIDFGVRSQDQCVVVPRDNGTETLNTKYGQEIENIVCQYVFHASRAPGPDFVSLCLDKWSNTNRSRWEQIMQESREKSMDPISYLATPEACEHRLEMLNEFVINGGALQLSHEQVTLNVHDVVRGRHLCGMSGTINRPSLPEGFNYDLFKGNMRKVEAETYLRVGNRPVTEFQNDKHLLEELIKIAGNSQYNCIINQGTAIGNLNTLDIVRQLRAVRSNRQYVFIDPTIDPTDPTRERMAFIWLVGETHPRPFDPNLVDPSSCLYYFGPADSRGTDFVIRSGNTVLITGPTTQQSQFAQGAFRRRDLGVDPTNTVDIWISAAVGNRIRTIQGLKEGESLQSQHVFNDIKHITVNEQGVLNFDSEMQRVRGRTFTKLRHLVFQESPGEKLAKERGVDYWNPELERQRELDVELENALFDITRSIMIQDRKLEWDAPLQPTQMVPPMTRIRNAYLEEVQKLGKIKEEIEKARDKMAKMDPQGMNFTPWLERYRTILAEIQKQISDYEKTIQSLDNSSDEALSQDLPDRVASNAQSTENSQEQEQVQQQAQQQEQMEMQARAADQPLHGIIPDYVSVQLEFPFLNMCHFSTLELPGCGFEGLESMLVSPEASELFRASFLRGKPYVRLYVARRKREKFPRTKDGISWSTTHQFCLLTRADYNASYVTEELSSLDNKAVFSFDTDPSIQGSPGRGLFGTGLLKIHQEGGDPIYTKKDPGDLEVPEGVSDQNIRDFIRTVALTKLLIGLTNFTREERVEVEKWVKGLRDWEENRLRHLRPDIYEFVQKFRTSSTDSSRGEMDTKH